MYKIYYKSQRDGGNWEIQSWSETMKDAARVVKINEKHGYKSLMFDEDGNKWYTAFYDKEYDNLKVTECQKPNM